MNIHMAGIEPDQLSGESFSIHPRAGSKKLVVFFSGTGKSNGKFDFWKVGRQVRENLIFINNGNNQWYQSGVPGLGSSVAETVSRLKSLSSSLGATEIFAIGASMGGYGAVLYGSLLEAKVMAFGVDTLLKIPGSRSLQQMPKEVRVVYPDLVPVVRERSTRVQLYVGEMDPMDLVGASRLIGLPTASIETIRGVDHKCARFFLDHVGLLDTISAYLNDQPAPRIPGLGSILARPEVLDRIHRSHVLSTKSDWKGSAAEANAAIDLDPNCETARFLLGKALIQDKLYRQAAGHLAMVAAELPHFADGQFYHAQALRLDKQHDRAIGLFERYIERFGPSAQAFSNLAHCHLGLGDSVTAVENMKLAAELKPEVYAAKLDELRGRAPRSWMRNWLAFARSR